MKKVIAAVAALLIISLSLVGCNNDPLNKTNETSSTSTTNSAVSENKDYDDSLEGLEQLFVDKGYITVNDDRSNVTVMDAALIGAKEGNRYTSNINGAEVVVELYAYDVDNLDNTGNEIIKSVTEKGEFQILDLDPVKAYLSDSGKYLLIYNDKSNPAEGTENYTRMQTAIKQFKAF